MTIINSRFHGNTAHNGGAIASYGNSTLINTAYSGNNAVGSTLPTGYGGAIIAFIGGGNPSTFKLKNSTLAANHADEDTGGIYVSKLISTSNKYVALIENSIIWGNTDPNNAGIKNSQITGTDWSTIRYSTIQFLNGADPLLVDPNGTDNLIGTVDDDLRLAAGSPAIDAGDNAALPAGTSTDLDGHLRFFDDPGTVDTGLGSAPQVDRGALNSARRWQAPHLIESSLSDPPASAALGSGFPVTDTVFNQGIRSAAKTTTRYYLSLDAAKSSNDKLLHRQSQSSLLAAGADSTGTVQVVVPNFVPVNTYYLLACPDDRHVVAESDENNNCIASTANVQIIAPDSSKQRLATRQLTHRSVAASRQPIPSPIRALPPRAARPTRYYLSLDTVKTGADLLLTGNRSVPSLSAAATSSDTVTVTVPPRPQPACIT